MEVIVCILGLTKRDFVGEDRDGKCSRKIAELEGRRTWRKLRSQRRGLFGMRVPNNQKRTSHSGQKITKVGSWFWMGGWFPERDIKLKSRLARSIARRLILHLSSFFFERAWCVR
jgi:hypothetical protein